MGVVMTFKLFKSLPQIRAFQRTLNHDIMIRRREATLQKKQQRRNLTFQSHLRVSKFLTIIIFYERFNFRWLQKIIYVCYENTFSKKSTSTFQNIKSALVTSRFFSGANLFNFERFYDEHWMFETQFFKIFVSRTSTQN